MSVLKYNNALHYADTFIWSSGVIPLLVLSSEDTVGLQAQPFL